MRLALRSTVVVAACACARAAAAQDGGRHAGLVLVLPASARAAALGGAYAAVGGDDAAVFYDPAQLATVRQGAGASVERYLASSTLSAFSVAARIGGGTLGVGVQSLAYDRADEIVDDAPTGRRLSGGELGLVAGFAHPVGPLRLGVAARLVQQRVVDVSGSAAAFDLGVALPLRGGVTVAAVAQQLGGARITLLDRGAPLPRRVAVGASVPRALGRHVSTLLAAEVGRTDGETARAVVAGELRWTVRALTVDGRIGARTRPGGSAASPVTLGAGIGARALALDYAYQSYALLGGTHRLGVRWAR